MVHNTKKTLAKLGRVSWECIPCWRDKAHRVGKAVVSRSTVKGSPWEPTPGDFAKEVGWEHAAGVGATQVKRPHPPEWRLCGHWG